MSLNFHRLGEVCRGEKVEELKGYRDERPCQNACNYRLACCNSLPYYNTGYRHGKKTVKKLFITTAVLVVFCLIAIAFFYAMVYLELRKRNLSDISQTISRRKKLESKVAKTGGLVTVSLVVSFVPGIMIAIFLELFPALRRSLLVRVPGLLFILPSLLNPLIYFSTNQRFRNALLVLLKIRKSQVIEPSENFCRRKEPSALFECVDMQIGERDIGLARSGSSDAALVSELGHPWPREIKLKRFMSAPSRPERNSREL